MKLHSLLAAAAFGGALLASTAAQAVNYSVNLTVGPGSVTGSIDTDGTFGILNTGNITDWSLLLNDGSGTFLLDGMTNSQVVVFGTGFTATATGIFFDFAKNTGFNAVDFQNPTIGSSVNYFCLNDAGGGCSGNPSAIGLRLTGAFLSEAQNGVTLIGSAGNVPEPANWALLIAGFGLAGAAMRRRRETVRVTYA